MHTSTTAWSTVIDAVLQRDPHEGTYALHIYNADESEVSVNDIDAVHGRAAMLEATSWLKEQGWDPTGRWEDSNEGHGGNTINAATYIRRFRKQAN
jgi:hypothetical protein